MAKTLKETLTEDIHLLLHKLWTKAVDTPGYDKKEWSKLQRLIEDLSNIKGGS